jgi:signal transduction histidine kinase/GGDEF domain-containing protein
MFNCKINYSKECLVSIKQFFLNNISINGIILSFVIFIIIILLYLFLRKKQIFSRNFVKHYDNNLLPKSETLIIEEKSKLKSIVKSIVEGVIIIDEVDDILILNAHARKILEFHKSEDINYEILERKLLNLNLNESIIKCRKLNKLVAKEIIISNFKGKHFFHCYISPIKDMDEKTIGLVIVLRDITKEKEVDNMKSEFVATVSHELRTPLSITKEGISLVLDEIAGKINEQQKKILVTANDNICRLERIINNLLDISKIESGKIRLKRKFVNFKDVLEKSAELFKTKAKKKGIKLKTKISLKDIEVYIDADKIIQVFTNLIGNALKFTEKGYIEISVKELDDNIECKVCDTGIGISKEGLDKIFNKFHQVERKEGGGERGTGLGLSISRKIIEMHKGKIKAKSVLGQGTEFIFSFPKYTPGKLISEYSEDGIQNAIRNNVEFSLLVVKIRNIQDLKETLKKQKLDYILENMKDIIFDSLGREGDIAIKSKNNIFVFLQECTKEARLKVEGRLEQVLIQYLMKQKLINKIDFHFGACSYPEEAKNSKELLNKALI